jgi:hypothetical protein
MMRTRRFLASVIAPAMLLGVLAVSSVAAGGDAGKVSLCHWADHKFVKISVSMSAEPAHLRHGDVATDEYGDCGGEQVNGGDSRGTLDGERQAGGWESRSGDRGRHAGGSSGNG